MIKPTELRIGNSILFDGEIKTVTSRMLGYINNANRFKNKSNLIEFEPIPLTEKILLKFGFKRDSTGCLKFSNCLYWLPKCYNSDTGILQIAVGMTPIKNCPCQYVHQLQNLYFALTGEELTLK